ncbi:MAG: RluA family pseudouridine synthase [Clostridiales bacterium]|nr:RluA family pseudouridine synthase [Clostridiales bacterium]
MNGEEQVYRFVIGPEDSGRRMDAVLAGLMEDCSRSYLQKLIEGGSVQVNGAENRTKKYAVKEGDLVELAFDPPELLSALPEEIPLEIVYEDDDLLVVNKQKGLVVHPAPGTPSGTLVNGLLHHCEGRLSSINGVVRPGIVHRIDKDTSGLLVVAKTDLAHRGLAEQLAVHSMTRAYRALACGNLKAEEGTVDKPLGRDPNNRLRMAVAARDGKRAVTHWKVLERFGTFTLMEARLETGRTHQIRVHMASLGHPLAGDPVYGPKKDTLKANGQMLHAWLLGFIHPRTGEYMEFQAPLPAEFEQVLEKLRRETK